MKKSELYIVSYLIKPLFFFINPFNFTHILELKFWILIDSLMKVYVTAMDTVNHFWVQEHGHGISALNNLNAMMHSYYKDCFRTYHRIDEVSRKAATL